jgi:hypothetical protein
MKAFSLILAVFLLLAALVLPVFAQDRCLPWPAILEQLADRWGEAPMWEGTRADVGRFVVLANPDGTTWTILLRRPDGQACALAAGEGWALPAAPKPGEDG